jgi:hypothetical protein
VSSTLFVAKKNAFGEKSLVEGPSRNDHLKQTAMWKPHVVMTINSMISSST